MFPLQNLARKELMHEISLLAALLWEHQNNTHILLSRYQVKSLYLK